jgi:methionine synthase II (cobalamin-independent)
VTITHATATTFRADVVGSLLRPDELKDARDRLHRGDLSHPAFKRIEDRAVDGAIRLQESVGLDDITDGELRREIDELEPFTASCSSTTQNARAVSSPCTTCRRTAWPCWG